MDFKAALKIVIELAEGNMLSDKEANSPELREEQLKQALALAKIESLQHLLFHQT